MTLVASINLPNNKMLFASVMSVEMVMQSIANVNCYVTVELKMLFVWFKV